MARKTSGKSDTVIAFPGASHCTKDGGAAEIVALLESYLIRACRVQLSPRVSNASRISRAVSRSQRPPRFSSRTCVDPIVRLRKSRSLDATAAKIFAPA